MVTNHTPDTIRVRKKVKGEVTETKVKAHYSLRLTGKADSLATALATGLVVKPGDTVRLQVYAKYVDVKQQPTLMPLAQHMLLSTQQAGRAASEALPAVKEKLAEKVMPLAAPQDKKGVPKAYLNYLVFDTAFQVIELGYRQISEQAKEDGTGKKHEPLLLETVIKEPGYVYTYVSNESAGSEVFFDDMQVSQSSYSNKQFILKDHLGSTRMLLSESNAILYDYDYDVYGKTVASTSSTIAPYVPTYTGQEYAWRFGLYNYGARFYDAELGRFLACVVINL